MSRIAFGGIQHETNTFAPTPATYEDFEMPDGWPALSQGAAIFEAVAGINLPIAGFIEAARAQGHELLPLAWSSATPSAQVAEDAFERLIGDMIARLKALGAPGAIDGVYLDLHGAMVTETWRTARARCCAGSATWLGRASQSWLASIFMPISLRKWLNLQTV